LAGRNFDGFSDITPHITRSFTLFLWVENTVEIWFKILRNMCRGYDELQIWEQITILVEALQALQ